MESSKARVTFKWCLGLAMVSCLSACDGGINISADGAVRSMTAGEVFRGVAFRHETIGEDENKSDTRRALYERAASDSGVKVDAKLLDLITANQHYSDLDLSGQRVAGAMGGDGAALVKLGFKVDHRYEVEVNFIVPERRFIGPVYLHKLPILNGVSLSASGKPMQLGLDDATLLIRAIGSDHDALANLLNKVAQRSQGNADLEKACRQQLSNGDFEVDPSLTDKEKEKAYGDHQRQVEVDVANCVHGRMS